MNFSHSTPALDRWSVYQQLELIPERALPSREKLSQFAFGVDRAWKLLISLLLDELVTDQQVEYLDRCWELDPTAEVSPAPTRTLQRLWVLMN